MQPATSNQQAEAVAAEPRELSPVEVILIDLAAPYVVRLTVDHSATPPVIVSAAVEAEPATSEAEPVAVAEPQAEPEPVAATVEAEPATSEPEPVAVAEPVAATVAATVDGVALSRAVARLAKLVKKVRRPSLRSVRVTFGGDFLTLSATDCDAEAVEVIDATGGGSGRDFVAIVDAAELAAAVKSQAKRGDVELFANGVDITIGGATVATFDADAVASYPVDNFATYSQAVAALLVPAATLSRSLAATVDACDSDSGRFALGGVRLELLRGSAVDNPAAAEVVATDGRRLHRFTIGDGVDRAADIVGAIVPAAAVRLIIDAAKFATTATVELLTEPATSEAEAEPVAEPQAEPATSDAEPVAPPEPEPVAVRFTFFNHNGLELRAITSRLIDGRYPRWRDACQVANVNAVEVDAERFLSLLQQAKPITDAENRAVDVDIVGNRLTVDIPRKFQAAATIADYAEPVALSLDITYLIYGVEACRAESATVRILGGGPDYCGPAQLRAGRLLVVVMPLTRKYPQPATQAEPATSDAEPVAEAATV